MKDKQLWRKIFNRCFFCEGEAITKWAKGELYDEWADYRYRIRAKEDLPLCEKHNLEIMATLGNINDVRKRYGKYFTIRRLPGKVEELKQ